MQFGRFLFMKNKIKIKVREILNPAESAADREVSPFMFLLLFNKKKA